MPDLNLGNFGAVASGLGLTVEVGTVFGSITLNPSTGDATPGDSRGGSGVGGIGLAVLRFLGLTVTVKTPVADFGPFPLVPDGGNP